MNRIKKQKWLEWNLFFQTVFIFGLQEHISEWDAIQLISLVETNGCGRLTGNAIELAGTRVPAWRSLLMHRAAKLAYIDWREVPGSPKSRRGSMGGSKSGTPSPRSAAGSDIAVFGSPNEKTPMATSSKQKAEKQEKRAQENATAKKNVATVRCSQLLKLSQKWGFYDGPLGQTIGRAVVSDMIRSRYNLSQIQEYCATDEHLIAEFQEYLEFCNLKSLRSL